jgi:stage II sporulation protein D
MARLVIALLLACGAASAQPSDVRIGVLGLFEPATLTIGPIDSGFLRFEFAGTQAVEGHRVANLEASGDTILATINGRTIAGDQLVIEDPSSFELSVPGKLSRRYSGSLVISAIDGRLQPIVTMALETTVAAVLAAESDLTGPEHALLAQVVASRSYLAAGPRHDAFDFCDTTHCQYLTDSFDQRAQHIAELSKGTVLTANGRIVRALFTRSCDGRTRTPQELGLPGGTIYQSASCPVCARDPHTWFRTHALSDVVELIRERTEQARLRVVRSLGWDAVPSNAYRTTTDGDTVTFEGVGEGHGMGLCQRGSVGLAKQGDTWQQILQRYFPSATIQRAEQN